MFFFVDDDENKKRNCVWRNDINYRHSDVIRREFVLN